MQIEFGTFNKWNRIEMDFFEVAKDGSSPVLEADVASSTNATTIIPFYFECKIMRE